MQSRDPSCGYRGLSGRNGAPLPLVALTYVSAALAEWGTPPLDGIGCSSARHNARPDVTGLLLYSSGSFLQLIEGEERAVINTFNRIEQDPRHSDITVVDWRFIVDRPFGQWRMAMHRLGQAHINAHPHLAPWFEDCFDASTLTARPGIAFEILAPAAGRACCSGEGHARWSRVARMTWHERLQPVTGIPCRAAPCSAPDRDRASE